MSGRAARPARYRPGKAPAPERDESSDDDAPEPVAVAPAPEPKLPSHTTVPAVFSAGVTIQQGDEAIRFPHGKVDTQEAPAPDVDLSEYGRCEC